MIYLASPYSDPDPTVREQRFEAACAMAAAMLRVGQAVFSPIVHSHPLVAYGLPTDWAFWQRVDVEHLRRCDGVAVLMLDGWDRSSGVREEVCLALELGKPVRYIASEAATQHRSIRPVRQTAPIRELGIGDAMCRAVDSYWCWLHTQRYTLQTNSGNLSLNFRSDPMNRAHLRRLCRFWISMALLTAALLLGFAPASGRSTDERGICGTGSTSPLGQNNAAADIRFDGTEVTTAALSHLAGAHWGTVTLADARFNGAIVESLRHAGSIQTLTLSGEGLSGQIPRLAHISGLTGLRIQSRLTVRDLEALGNLVHLKHLGLPSELALNTTGARAIAELARLKSLQLYRVDVDDAAFRELAPLVELEELDLTHTRVTDDGLQVLLQMPHLRTLKLYRHPHWHISQQLSDGCVPILSRLSELETLSLSGDISDAGLAVIAKLPRLQTLAILNTRITAAGLAALRDSTVQNLTLSDQQVGLHYVGEHVVGEDSDLLRSMPGVANLRQIAALQQITIIGNALANPDLKLVQRLLPGKSVGFIDP